jgi:hypothetical protein
VSIELAELREPSWLSRLRAAIVRFLVKVAFFTVMTALGANGVYWIPIPDPNDLSLNWGDLVVVAVFQCSACMFFGGLIGLAVTVFTGGHKPRWD